ncbi:FtsK/SpoIIIE domain-containing protein [Paenibacillus sp. y28]|uniref:FtsK/SpoIIIE domain-containing protein n=1 Tax=Paenibacillus sp. y28 TaxID=3129110 RepID=UPI003015A95F
MEEKQAAKKQEADKGLANLGYMLLATGAVMQWGFDNPAFEDPGRIVMKAGGVLFVLFVLWPYVRKNRASLLDKVRQLLRRGTKGIQPATLLHVRTDPAPVSGSGVVGNKSGVSILFDGHKEPFSFLPVNPNPIPSGTITAEIAAHLISDTLQLNSFSVDEPIQILNIQSGPTLQTVAFQLPPKIQLSMLTKKRDDIANHAGFQTGFDIMSSPYKSSAAFAIPHKKRAFVYLRECLADPEVQAFIAKAQLPIVIGKDMLGKTVTADLTKMPHLLMGGATGSGKSVSLNVILASLLLTRSPEELKLLLLDPKLVELSAFEEYPHLLAPPVTDMRRAALAMQKVVVEMDRRYELLNEHKVRNIIQYNMKNPDAKMPYIVVVVDEYAELMMVVASEVEDAVQRIAQKARAAGIHMILATQRPSADVVTGVIKANLPSRISYKLQNYHDYKTILDASAPPLMGHGDGMMIMNGEQPVRIQSACISAKEGEDIQFLDQLKAYWNSLTKEQSGSSKENWGMENEEDNPYSEEQDPYTVPPWEEGDSEDSGINDASLQVAVGHTKQARSSYPGVAEAVDREELYRQATQLLHERGNISADILKAVLGIPYVPASSIMSRMDEEGLLGPLDPDTRTRPKVEESEQLTDEVLLKRMKLYICQTRSTRTDELRSELGVRKERIIGLLQQLIEEGFLAAPINRRAGYEIEWNEEQIQEYLSGMD